MAANFSDNSSLDTLARLGWMTSRTICFRWSSRLVMNFLVRKVTGEFSWKKRGYKEWSGRCSLCALLIPPPRTAFPHLSTFHSNFAKSTICLSPFRKMILHTCCLFHPFSLDHYSPYWAKMKVESVIASIHFLFKISRDEDSGLETLLLRAAAENTWLFPKIWTPRIFRAKVGDGLPNLGPWRICKDLKPCAEEIETERVPVAHLSETNYQQWCSR